MIRCRCRVKMFPGPAQRCLKVVGHRTQLGGLDCGFSLKSVGAFSKSLGSHLGWHRTQRSPPMRRLVKRWPRSARGAGESSAARRAGRGHSDRGSLDRCIGSALHPPRSRLGPGRRERPRTTRDVRGPGHGSTRGDRASDEMSAVRRAGLSTVRASQVQASGAGLRAEAMTGTATMTQVLQDFARHGRCCHCGRRPSKIETRQQIYDDTIDVLFRCECRGREVHMVGVDGLVLALGSGSLFGRYGWELLHPFPRSCARYGEVSKGARAEARRRRLVRVLSARDRLRRALAGSRRR